MDCGRYKRNLSAYLDGELPGVEMISIREHLRECPGCETELGEIRLYKMAMSKLQPAIPTASFEAQILSALSSATQPSCVKLSVAVRNWIHERFAVRIQPSVAAVCACAAMFLAVLGHLPSGNIQWTDPFIRDNTIQASVSDNYHNSTYTVIPASAGALEHRASSVAFQNNNSYFVLANYGR